MNIDVNLSKIQRSCLMGTYIQALRWGAEKSSTLKSLKVWSCEEQPLVTKGGFAPRFDEQKWCETIIAAIKLLVMFRVKTYLSDLTVHHQKF